MKNNNREVITATAPQTAPEPTTTPTVEPGTKESPTTNPNKKGDPWVFPAPNTKPAPKAFKTQGMYYRLL